MKDNKIPKAQWGRLLARLARGVVKSPAATKSLVKAYSKRGTGLSNPYIRKDLAEAMKDPDTAQQFMIRYNQGKAPDMHGIWQIERANEEFSELEGLFPGVDLNQNWYPYTLNEASRRLPEELANADAVIQSYNNKLKLIQDTDSRLFDIIKSSPQYTSQIYSDIKSGKVKDIDSYIAELVKSGNTFMRRMDVKQRPKQMRDKPFTEEDFLTIRGGQMDVGSPMVVNDHIMGYGNDAWIYMPKFESSSWNQRFPQFNEESITLHPTGMHTHGLSESLGDRNLMNIAAKYAQSQGVSARYIPDTRQNYTHMVFTTPYQQPVSIADQYIAFPATEENIKLYKPVFGRGLKSGGKLIPKAQKGLITKVLGKALGRVLAKTAKTGSKKIVKDISYKDEQHSLNKIKQYFASQKIHGKDIGVNGLVDNTTTGLPQHVIDNLNENTIERNIRAMRDAGYSELEINQYKQRVNDLMRKVKVGRYSGRDYKDADVDFDGFYDNDQVDGFISYNNDSESFTPTDILKHEARHLLDYRAGMVDKLYKYLSDAYDDDFLNLPNLPDANHLKGYKLMDRERVSTNRDARDKLLQNISIPQYKEKFQQSNFAKLSPDMVDAQNSIIKDAFDNEIFEAVETANGYGKRYIKYLRDNNKLTHEKANQFRKAMMYVGGYTLPIMGGVSLIEQNNNK